MSNDWVPKPFNDLKKNGNIKDVDRAAEDLLASVDSTFKPLGVDAGIEKRQVVRKVANTELCPKCSKPLEGRVLVAMEQKFHMQCFTCSQCDKPIEDGFTVRGGQPWCGKCVEWSENEKPVAKAAGGAGGAKKAGAGAKGGAAAAAASGANVVEDPESKIAVNRGDARSAGEDSSDVDPMRGFQAKNCAKCGHNITVGLDYNGASYCAECFTCSRCKSPIDVTQGFLPQGNKVYCSLCAHAATGPTVKAAQTHKCHGCGDEITGKFLKIDGKFWHNECFACSNCGVALDAGFAVKGKERFCPACADAHGNVLAEVVPLEKPIDGIRIDTRTGAVRQAEYVDPHAVKDTAPKFCFSCGTKCEGKKFCPGCGTKVQA
eukprot:TRINITY_DN873_c0_g1_i1.p1 TRINITY_DN873_c0_g1~~TRINITY_DN873_c0_g1_i1.p1  ORF type:complete len:375 (-),score=87.01 TRINITY_DN873_c0_g1_i1:167-1291(-)